MYVCVCHAVTDHRIREAVAEGEASFEGLQDRLEVSTSCGCCESEVREILDECLHKQTSRQRLFAAGRHEPLSALR